MVVDKIKGLMSMTDVLMNQDKIIEQYSKYSLSVSFDIYIRLGVYSLVILI